jgi:RimJ/RimL family protein N-acetyltransferase
MNLNKVKLGVFDGNDRAHAVYRKCGFVEDGRLRQEYYQDGRYWDVIQMSVLRDEFYALHGVTGAQTARA